MIAVPLMITNEFLKRNFTLLLPWHLSHIGESSTVIVGVDLSVYACERNFQTDINEISVMHVMNVVVVQRSSEVKGHLRRILRLSSVCHDMTDRSSSVSCKKKPLKSLFMKWIEISIFRVYVGEFYVQFFNVL